MPSDQRVHARGLEIQGPNPVHVQNVVFLGLSFLEVHILTTTYQKAFILGPKEPYRVGSHPITLVPQVSARVMLEVKNYKTSKICICALKVSRSPYLYKHLPESIQTWTITTLLG